MECLKGMSLMANRQRRCGDSRPALWGTEPPEQTREMGQHHSAGVPVGTIPEITKLDSPIILFGQGLFSARLMLSQSKMWRYNLVWQKDRVTGHLNANRMPLRQHEDILVFYKKQPVYHPQMSYKPGQKNHPRGMFKRMTNRCYGCNENLRPRVSLIGNILHRSSICPKNFGRECSTIRHRSRWH